jgi:hypothetical protein
MGEKYGIEVLGKLFDAHTRRMRKHLGGENISSMTCPNDSPGDKWILLSKVVLVQFPYQHIGVVPTAKEKFSILSPAEGIHAAIRSVVGGTKRHLAVNFRCSLPCVTICPVNPQDVHPVEGMIQSLKLIVPSHTFDFRG